MKCFVCGGTPVDGVDLFRVNATGQKAVWACEQHVKNTDAPPIPQEVKDVVRVIKGRNG